MDSVKDLTVIGFSMVAVISVISIVILAWSAVKSTHRTTNTHLILAKYLLHLRLSGVMQAMGITPKSYLLRVKDKEILRQMRTCEICGARPRCSSDLGRAAQGETFTYCPSYRQLSHLRKNSVKLSAA